MKVFVTKNALTKGIEEFDAYQLPEQSGTIGIREIGAMWDTYIYQPHWHTTREDAVEQANRMRIAQIESHRGSIARLQAMKFQ